MVESMIKYDPPLINEVWNHMKGLYKTAASCPKPPARVTLAQVTVDQEEIYRQVPLPGDSIILEVSPSPSNDYIPTV